MIVFCHLLNDNSGSPVILRQSIRELSKGTDGNLLLVGSQGCGCLETAGVRIQRYWYRRSRFRFLTLFTYFASQIFLYRALSRANLPRNAAIYVNTLLPFGAALWARRNGHALLYHVHEVSISPAPLRRFLVKMVERTADMVLYVSDDNRQRLPIADVPSAVLPNPIDPEIAEVGRKTAYTPRRSGQFEVLMLASPRDFKGVPEFLDLARLLDDRPDMKFTLGLNGSPQEVAQYLPAANRPANVTVHPRTDTPGQFYATADVLVNMSRVDMWIETFGLTIVEGMAFGLPVVAPPVGGPTEIVTFALDGYLIDSRNTQEIAQALCRLADDPETAMALSTAARRRSEAFTIERFSAQLHQEIETLRSTKGTT